MVLKSDAPRVLPRFEMLQKWLLTATVMPFPETSRAPQQLSVLLLLEPVYSVETAPRPREVLSTLYSMLALTTLQDFCGKPRSLLNAHRLACNRLPLRDLRLAPIA